MAEATAIAPDLVVQSDAFRHWYGIVRDPGGGPIAGATVELGGSRTLSNAEGRFDLELGANVQGRLPLRASASGYARTQREL
ncbi:MAG TPA: carboxypeptidase-like regulatory domain-containing protein, partial [Planctomycetota bacterium]|nr:carboxypeptidase-like regulatory domain-containing protein [Planctomycetota bacterium]